MRPRNRETQSASEEVRRRGRNGFSAVVASLRRCCSRREASGQCTGVGGAGALCRSALAVMRVLEQLDGLGPLTQSSATPAGLGPWEMLT